MILFFLSLLFPCFAIEIPDLIEVHDTSSINWTKMRLQGVGTLPLSEAESYSKQEVQALSLANEALLDSFSYFYLDAETQIEDTYKDDAKTKRYIQDNTRRYQVAETTYQTSEKVDVSVFLELHTLLRPVILSQTTIKDNPPIPSNYTGIVIDARSIDFKPIFFPTINKGTQEWLLASYFSEDSAKTKLPFIYSNTAAHPSVIKRVGKKPAIYQVESGYKDTIQLNEVNAPELSAAEAKALLANGTVVILLSNL
jgi:hypothetical protein